MKNVLHTLMITAAVMAFTVPAHAASMTTKTTVMETGVARDPALLQAAKNRMTRDLQAELTQRGYTVDLTGEYDVKTANAVRAYQKDNNLPVTGEASADLLVALGVDTDLGPTKVVEHRKIMSYKMANKGSENANVYDDPNADRTGDAVYTQRYKRMTEVHSAPGVTTTETTTVYTRPLFNQ